MNFTSLYMCVCVIYICFIHITHCEVILLIMPLKQFVTWLTLHTQSPYHYYQKGSHRWLEKIKAKQSAYALVSDNLLLHSSVFNGHGHHHTATFISLTKCVALSRSLLLLHSLPPFALSLTAVPLWVFYACVACTFVCV